MITQSRGSRPGQAIVRRQETRPLNADRATKPDEVQAMGKQKLPNYVQPARIVQPNDLPRTANGKIDRTATKAFPRWAERP